MNIQAMMKQAQKLQNEMLNEKKAIDEKIFEGKSSFVTVKIDAENLEKDDIEMLQDMILVAINEANHQVDLETEQKMGKYTKGMPGLF